MTIQNILTNLTRDLIRTFAVVDEWFDKADALHRHKPPSGGWSPGEVLEHIMLTNHFLLLLIEKGQEKALRRKTTEALEQHLENYCLTNPRLLEIGEHKSFAWERPEHHAPTGSRPLPAIRKEIRDQLYRCLYTLELLPDGEGVLYKTTMSVNDLGKLDVYQYLYFLALHAKRHITQLEKIEKEFNFTSAPYC
jgi:hypothetical protein